MADDFEQVTITQQNPFTAENVARMIINRGRSGTESLRKGDLLHLIFVLRSTNKGWYRETR